MQVEGLTLLLGLLAVHQKFVAKELRPIELDPLYALLC